MSHPYSEKEKQPPCRDWSATIADFEHFVNGQRAGITHLRKWLTVLLYIGVAVSTFLFLSTIVHGLAISVVDHHIVYDTALPWIAALLGKSL